MPSDIPPWLPSDAGYVDLQQVSASERAALHLRLTDVERERFGDRIEDVAARMGNLPPDLIDYELDLLDGDPTNA